MENTKKITAREMRFIAKAAIDNALTALADQYGVDALQSKTVQHILDTEATCAARELAELGEIQSLRAREGWNAAKA